MFKQALTLLFFAGVLLTTGFTSKSQEEVWMATIQLEGKSKAVTLASEAVYGGYNPADKKFFLFGKNHMFQNPQNEEFAKIFRDLFTTNASGQFQFELNGVARPAGTATPVVYNGNISFKKRHAIAGTFRKVTKGGKSFKEIVVREDFKNLDIVLTEEAANVMTGKFTLTFTSK